MWTIAFLLVLKGLLICIWDTRYSEKYFIILLFLSGIVIAIVIETETGIVTEKVQEIATEIVIQTETVTETVTEIMTEIVIGIVTEIVIVTETVVKTKIVRQP